MSDETAITLAFEHPGGGPPVGADRLVEGFQGPQIEFDTGLAEFLAEFRTAAALAMDRAEGTAAVACGVGKPAVTPSNSSRMTRKRLIDH